MNNEEKLLKLLQIAVENGCKYCEFTLKFALDNGIEHISLNDLVTNFEYNEISFIEALCKNVSYENLCAMYSNCETFGMGIENAIRLTWALTPTSQRLEWLFETFKHLLN